MTNRVSLLNRQADYISSSIRLATNAPMRRIAPLGAVAGQPGPLLVICIIHACASFHSFKHGYLSLQKCSLFSRIFGESSTISISHVAKLVTNRVSLLPGSLFSKYLQIEKQPVPLVQVVFLTGSYLSSQAASNQVLSTYKGLTTVFGMGTGGSP